MTRTQYLVKARSLRWVSQVIALVESLGYIVSLGLLKTRMGQKFSFWYPRILINDRSKMIEASKRRSK